MNAKTRRYCRLCGSLVEWVNLGVWWCAVCRKYLDWKQTEVKG